MTTEQTDVYTACANMETEELIERLDSKSLTTVAEDIYKKELMSRGFEYAITESHEPEYKSYTESAGHRLILVALSLVMLSMAAFIVIYMKSIPLGATSILTFSGLFLLIKYSRKDQNIILTVYPDYLEYSPSPDTISTLFFKDVIEYNQDLKLVEINNHGTKKAATFVVKDDHGHPVTKHITAITRLSKTDRKEVYDVIQRFIDKR